MTFKDIRQGNMVYMLHKGDELRACVGKVKKAGAPRFPQYGTAGNALGMVVDLEIEAAQAEPVETGSHKEEWAQNKEEWAQNKGSGTQKESRTYVVPADSMIASAGQVVVSVDRDGILREVETLEAESEEALNSMERHRKRKEECERIREEWNPELAEKKQQDERIGAIEGKVDSLATMLRGFIKEMKGE